MIRVRQLFDYNSYTYTYLVYDDVSSEAILIDPVFEQLSRDLKLIDELSINLKYVCETHIHADHITSSGNIAEKLDTQIVISEHAGIKHSKLYNIKSNNLKLGQETLNILHTPGHTKTCISIYTKGYVFTGDALLIRKCGRTDFQDGSSAELYNSVQEKLFALPDNTVVFPGHDYTGQTSSTIGEEKLLNERLNLSISKDRFIEIMNNLNLSYPKRMDEAVPANLKLGIC